VRGVVGAAERAVGAGGGGVEEVEVGGNVGSGGARDGLRAREELEHSVREQLADGYDELVG